MYLTGVGVGETTLFAVDDNDTVLMSTKIRVTHNLGALRSGIAKVAPGQKVSVATVDQSLVLTGIGRRRPTRRRTCSRSRASSSTTRRAW